MQFREITGINRMSPRLAITAMYNLSLWLAFQGICFGEQPPKPLAPPDSSPAVVDLQDPTSCAVVVETEMCSDCCSVFPEDSSQYAQCSTSCSIRAIMLSER